MLMDWENECVCALIYYESHLIIFFHQNGYFLNETLPPDSYYAKTLKKHTPLVRFALYFHNQAIFRKS